MYLWGNNRLREFARLNLSLLYFPFLIEMVDNDQIRYMEKRAEKITIGSVSFRSQEERILQRKRLCFV